MHRVSESAKVLLQQRANAEQGMFPVPTECNPSLFEFARVEGRAVVASFDGGRMTSDAGALLGAADLVIGLTRRLASYWRSPSGCPFRPPGIL